MALLAATIVAGCGGGYGGGTMPASPTLSFANVHPYTNCPKQAGGTGLLSDGDFSQAAQPSEYMGFNKGQSFAPAWRRVTKGEIKLVSSTYWNVNGLCSIDLDGGTAGTITHNGVATTVQAKYTVTFYLSGNGDGGPAIKTLKLSAASASKTFTWDTSNGNDPRHRKFAKKSWTFTAVKPASSLKFASLDPPGTYGPVIAGISVKKT
jgi:hypothetical protein